MYAGFELLSNHGGLDTKLALRFGQGFESQHFVQVEVPRRPIGSSLLVHDPVYPFAGQREIARNTDLPAVEEAVVVALLLLCSEEAALAHNLHESVPVGRVENVVAAADHPFQERLHDLLVLTNEILV